MMNDISPLLNRKKQDKATLHHRKRGRPDMELVTSFLKAQVSTPIEEDWLKLKRDIAFYKQTRSDERVIWHDNLQPLYTWVDTAYYTAHLNIHSQTGIAAMPMG